MMRGEFLAHFCPYVSHQSSVHLQSPGETEVRGPLGLGDTHNIRPDVRTFLWKYDLLNVCPDLRQAPRQSPIQTGEKSVER